MRKLDAGDRNDRVRKRLEPGHRRAPPIDRAVVLFDEIVEILCSNSRNTDRKHTHHNEKFHY
jgi:hypothetical protein